MINCYLHSEIKVGGVWHHYSASSLKTDLDLFEKLGWDGDDSSSPIAIAKSKGLPQDISVVTKIDWDIWINDACCQSWFNDSEISKVARWYDNRLVVKKRSLREQVGYLFGNSFELFTEFSTDYPTEIEDIRWVFWFG